MIWFKTEFPYALSTAWFCFELILVHNVISDGCSFIKAVCLSVAVITVVLVVWDACPVGECWRGTGPSARAYLVKTDLQTGLGKIF